MAHDADEPKGMRRLAGEMYVGLPPIAYKRACGAAVALAVTFGTRPWLALTGLACDMRAEWWPVASADDQLRLSQQAEALAWCMNLPLLSLPYAQSCCQMFTCARSSDFCRSPCRAHFALVVNGGTPSRLYNCTSLIQGLCHCSCLCSSTSTTECFAHAVAAIRNVTPISDWPCSSLVPGTCHSLLQMKRLEEDSERMQPRITARLAELTELLAAETVAREAADAGNLKLVAAAMERLQREALMNFGTEDVVREHAAGAGAAGEDDDGDEAEADARGGAGGR